MSENLNFICIYDIFILEVIPLTDFGIRLAKAMQDKKISAADLSRMTGIGKSLISYYINGRCLAKQDKVYLIAKALGVDPGWLMTGVEPTDDSGLPKREFTVFVPSPIFAKMTSYMTQEDYENVVKAFERAYERMKELGVSLDD